VTSFQIPSRSFRLFIIPNQPRVVWTNASVSYQPSGDDRLVATLRGPADLPGFAEVWAPDATSVLVNGQPLRRALRAGVGAYGFDPTSGVVHLRVSYQEPVQIEVLWPA
jgi:hypothetical protein